MRFDEIELEPVPFGGEVEAKASGGRDEVATSNDAVASSNGEAAPRLRRLLALLTDLSLFAALTLALAPLLPAGFDWMAMAALAGFVIVLSYYYFVGSWMLWGKTVGGAIFDVRIVTADARPMALRNATLRWAGVYASLATAGLGFTLAALPSRKSLPDRMSETEVITSR